MKGSTNSRGEESPKGLVWFPWRQSLGFGVCLMTQVPSASPTIKDCPAVLGGRGQRQAGGVEFVSIIPNADLELDGIIHILQHCGRVEGSKEGVFAPPEVFLRAE